MVPRQDRHDVIEAVPQNPDACGGRVERLTRDPLRAPKSTSLPGFQVPPFAGFNGVEALQRDRGQDCLWRAQKLAQPEPVD